MNQRKLTIKLFAALTIGMITLPAVAMHNFPSLPQGVSDRSSRDTFKSKAIVPGTDKKNRATKPQQGPAIKPQKGEEAAYKRVQNTCEKADAFELVEISAEEQVKIDKANAKAYWEKCAAEEDAKQEKKRAEREARRATNEEIKAEKKALMIETAFKQPKIAMDIMINREENTAGTPMPIRNKMHIDAGKLAVTESVRRDSNVPLLKEQSSQIKPFISFAYVPIEFGMKFDKAIAENEPETLKSMMSNPGLGFQLSQYPPVGTLVYNLRKNVSLGLNEEIINRAFANDGQGKPYSREQLVTALKHIVNHRDMAQSALMKAKAAPKFDINKIDVNNFDTDNIANYLEIKTNSKVHPGYSEPKSSESLSTKNPDEDNSILPHTLLFY